MTPICSGFRGESRVSSPRLNERSILLRPDCRRPLAKVLADYGERVCPGGPYGDIDDWSIYDESFRRLVTWAEESRCRFPDLEPLKTGGREHDLTFMPAFGEWLKFTKPSAAGYVVSFESGKPALENATPLEYLDRLTIQNEIFADTVSFLGVSGERFNPRMVTIQKDIPGVEASDEQIIHMMTEGMGFTRLPPRFYAGYENSLSFIRGDVAVFDLRPANVVLTPDGFIVPIDSIPVRLDAESRAFLGH